MDLSIIALVVHLFVIVCLICVYYLKYQVNEFLWFMYIPYLLEYKSHSCISRTPTLELKIGTKLF